jgi:hypothetical protein
MRQLFALMRDPSYQCLVDALPGYEAAGTGEVVSITDAFSLRT